MTVINDIFAREIIDSRGNPTVEVEVGIGKRSLRQSRSTFGASTGLLKLWS